MGVRGAASPSLADGATEQSAALGHYVRGLDGMRAASMAAVLLYHGEIPGFRGGFLGISAFFTLSGFLITSMLLRNHAVSGRIDLRSFWARRFRRLLPAAYLTLAGILVFGATVATQRQTADIPGGVVAALAEVANWFFIRTGQSYAALFTEPSPLQHFWSLAIEEQFYLLMPLALVLLLRAKRSVWVVAGALAAAIAASTAIMVTLFEHGASIDRLYYGTDTRAAELLVGALLAVLLHARPLPAARFRRLALPALGVGSAVVLGYCWTHFTLRDAFLYRGGFLLVALSSAALITSIVGNRGPVASVLSFGPIAAFGRITYGVYLFHWPIFLWLTEARTNLDRWPLFALRVGTTVAAATVSYHFLEMPVRRRAWRGRMPSFQVRWAVPAVILCILVGAFAVDQRDVHTNLAGLGDAPAALPAAVTKSDGVLSILLIADKESAALAPELRTRAEHDDKVRVDVAAPFGCAAVAKAAPHVCTNWAKEWPALIKRFNPDVVLFQVSDWARSRVASLSGSTALATQTQWTTRELSAGFDLLTARGATVVWGREGASDIGVAVRRNNEPFYQAMDTLVTSRSDVRRRAVTGEEIGPLLDDLALYQRRDASDSTRVMVVGDSIAQTMAYGLERWSAKGDKVVVWSDATGGCGIADAGKVLKAGGREAAVPSNCVGLAERFGDAVKRFRPDVVIVLSSIFDLQDRKLAGWPRFLGPGTKQFDDYLEKEYVDAYDTLSTSGARVVWMKNPCVHYTLGLVGGINGSFDNTRIQYVNTAILGRLAKARPAVRFFDLNQVLCPGGKFVKSLGGVKDVRTDGVHFSPEGSQWFADTYGRKLVDLGLAH